jgi:hypothetical protein
VFDGEEGAHLRTERKTTAKAMCVEEAGLDGDGRKRLRQHSSSSSRRPFVQRQPNAAALPAPSSSPVLQATSNESEWGEEKMSGSELRVG